MHRAYASDSCCTCVWLGSEPELGAPVEVFVLAAPPAGFEVAVVDVDVVVMLATAGGLPRPPQPAARSESAATVAVRTSAAGLRRIHRGNHASVKRL
jgi:hypothetical protein